MVSESAALDLTTPVVANADGGFSLISNDGSDKVLASRESTNKLHLIDWDEGMVAQVRQGFRTKLMAMTTRNEKPTCEYLSKTCFEGLSVIGCSSDWMEARYIIDMLLRQKS